MELLFVLGRILFGGFFVISGIRHFQHLPMMASFTGQKGMPAPKLAVIVSGLLILLGGLSILLRRPADLGDYRRHSVPRSGDAAHAQLLGGYRSVRQADEPGELSEERGSAGRCLDARHGAPTLADEPGSLTGNRNDRESRNRENSRSCCRFSIRRTTVSRGTAPTSEGRSVEMSLKQAAWRPGA